jgi:outer membrane protein TolC
MLPWKLIFSRKRIQLVHLSMKSLQSHVAALCVLMLAAPSTWAQQQQFQPEDKKEDTTPRLETERPHWFTPIIAKYQPKIIPPISVSNSPRIDSLIRAGNLYLSLQDAITLALENNIDIEVERYEYRLADTDLFRTKAGIPARGIPTGTSAGAGSITAGSGYFIGNAAAGIGTTAGGAGPLPITADPVFSGTIQWAHITTPQSNPVTFAGKTETITTAQTYNFGVSQGFSTGTAYTFSYNNSVQRYNYASQSFNPGTTSSFDLSVTQNLLQGFGPSLNKRNLRIANNNNKVADYVFQTQVMNTVSSIINLYWNLVSYIENVRVAQQSIASSQKLYDDNKKQVEIGTLAPIEVVRAQAEVASDQQVLVVAQTNVLQQETILKNALSRNGTANISIADVHIIPTDRIQIPATEPVEPIQDLYARALMNRPDLSQARLQIDNANINLSGTRNAMLPTLNAIGDLRNNGLAGTPNTLVNPQNGLAANPDPFFVGGYGTVLSQLFSRNFPNYSIGVQLNIPLRNRSAQADYATATLQLRQTELGLQKQISQIRVDVANALIARQQARAQYESATQARILQEQSLDAEQKKFQLGSSTPYNVILAQRDLATARQNEVTALTAYGLARVQLDQVTGATLENNQIQVDEARAGKVARPSNPVIPR